MDAVRVACKLCCLRPQRVLAMQDHLRLDFQESAKIASGDYLAFCLFVWQPD